MGYTNEADAPFILSAVSFGVTALKGVIGATAHWPVEREPLAADGHLSPMSRPVIRGGVDASVVITMYDLNSLIDYTTAAATLTIIMTRAGGGTSITIATGPLVPGTSDFDAADGGRGARCQQEFLLQGAFSRTITQ